MDVARCYLEGNADAVEFCPHDACRHVLAASTYTLQEGDRLSRAGSISLFNVGAELGQLDLFQRIETAGIFDIKWNPVGDSVSPLLAQVDADGYLRIHGLESCSDEAQGMECLCFSLKEITDEKISPSMCLFLDWNPSATSITVGLSDFSIRESQLETIEMWNAHDFEVWTTSFDIHQPQLLVFTNGFSIVNINGDKTEVIETYSKHESLAYGADWHTDKSLHEGKGNSTLVVTCSFYDRLLRIWTPESDSQGFSI
ncbi:diphthamide biosynthesis protein 7-like protein [Pyrus ussuriensis x Pyrus communis]|uniref:Diphthamide biosynthesis protein 7-like protein n=1 Tax=Pyrus ussuriensis x Pyrus communis TaxID=2448454 RepID=A0A5N5G1P2_9ROSA|nr:diphthamide biosynthesis protein 7-like protein [Pyrus ussuriensis x Pyrus communis]